MRTRVAGVKFFFCFTVTSVWIRADGKLLEKNTKGEKLVLYRIGFSLEPDREVKIFLGFAFQPSESM